MYILSSLKIKKENYRKEEWKSAQSRFSVMQIMTAKTTTLRALYVHVFLNSAIWLYIILYARHFLPIIFIQLSLSTYFFVGKIQGKFQKKIHR